MEHFQMEAEDMVWNLIYILIFFFALLNELIIHKQSCLEVLCISWE